MPVIHTLHHPHELCVVALREARLDLRRHQPGAGRPRGDAAPDDDPSASGSRIIESGNINSHTWHSWPHGAGEGPHGDRGRVAPAYAQARRRDSAAVPRLLGIDDQRIDGRNVEFIGEASLDVKNELLSNASALLFPIQ
jgi:hypothetical protein